MLTASLLAAATVAHAGDLVVEIKGVSRASGDIAVAVYDGEGTWLKRPLRSDKAPAQAGTVTFTFISLPPGEYAVSAFHDLNNNGQLDRNFIGIPKEPFGISNNATGNFGPPKFEQAKFKVGNTRDAISITLK
jgi:uncharacterized protein (DUF2141 family)